MKLAVVMGREPSYTRNKVILTGLAAAGVDIVEYTDPGRNYPERFARVLGRFVARPPRDVDAILIGFYGQPFVPFVSRLTKKPIVLDAFLSGYDTMCFDRKRFAPGSLRGRFFFWLDRNACERSDLVLLDTREHVRYFVDTFGLDSAMFASVFVGAETSVFHPCGPGLGDGRFKVFYYSTYHPVHGTEYVIRAARLLRDHADIEFTIVGAPRERVDVECPGGKPGQDNIEFIDWIPYRELPGAIARADLCLGGHFGSVHKSSRVIPGKVFQFLAMAKPTIVGDNPANRELLEDGVDALLVRMADARAIADAIIRLKESPALRERLAKTGYERFVETSTPAIIGGQIAAMVSDLLDTRG